MPFIEIFDSSGNLQTNPDIIFNNYSSLTTPAVDDQIIINDASASLNKRIALSDLWKVIGLLTPETAPATGDSLALFDVSAGTTDSILLSDLFKVIAALTGKTTPVGADTFVISDSAASNASKSLTLTNLVAALKTLIATDTLAALTDITTNNSSTSAHGFLKKLSNVSTEYMNGQGNWATPAAPASAACTAYRTSNLAIASTTFAAVDFDAESYDSGTIHDNSTNPSRFYAPNTGTYYVHFCIPYWYGNTYPNQLWAALYKNGSSLGASGYKCYGEGFGATYASNLSSGWTLALTAGDYVELYIRGSTSNTINLYSGTTAGSITFTLFQI